MNRLYSIAIGCVLLSIGLLTTSCGAGACTLVGCGSGVTVDFSGVDSATWQEGNWQLEMTTPAGEFATCEFQLPAGDDDITGSSCTGPLELVFTEDGTQLESASSSVSSPDEVPDRFDIDLLRDGSVVASKSFQPDYTQTRPNGEDCPPICAQATVEFSN